MKAIFNLVAAGLIIVVFIYGITQKQAVIAEGEIVYLKLAPVDPLSIMQGNYMRLRYAVSAEVLKMKNRPADKTGYLRLKLDDKKVASILNFDAVGELAADEILFKYQSPSYRIILQPDSFLFQQDLEKLYRSAKYGIFRVTDSEHLLVGLADEDLKEIKPPSPNAKTN